MVTLRFSLSLVLAAALLLQDAAIAMPTGSVAVLEKRAETKCKDGGLGPCICPGDALGLRLKKVKCPSNKSFKFVNTQPTDGTMKLFNDNTGSLECDHMVELQDIAKAINKVPDICTHFQSTAGAADFQSFFSTINDTPRLVFVDKTVNNAKGKLFGGNKLAKTTQKAANGAASYLKLIKSDVQTSATAIKTAMDTIMNGKGSSFGASFVSDYIARLDDLVDKATTEAKRLPPAPAPGDIIVDETASTIAKCKRSLWAQARDYIIARATGTKPPAAAACPVKKPATPAKSSAKVPAKATAKAPAKTTTKAPAKTTTKTPAKTTAKAPAKTSAKAPAPKKAAAPKKTTKKPKRSYIEDEDY